MVVEIELSEPSTHVTLKLYLPGEIEVLLVFSSGIGMSKVISACLTPEVKLVEAFV